MNTTKPPECWASDANARALRVETAPGCALLLPFDQFVFAECHRVEPLVPHEADGNQDSKSRDAVQGLNGLARSAQLLRLHPVGFPSPHQKIIPRFCLMLQLAVSAMAAECVVDTPSLGVHRLSLRH